MSKYKKKMCIILIFEISIIIIFNIFYYNKDNSYKGRMYRVEAKRVAKELESKSIDDIDMSMYPTIIKISEFDQNQNCNNDYVVENVNNKLYRIEYKMNKNNSLLYIDAIFIIMLLFTICIIVYINQKILKPFYDMSKLSCELAKGNLSVPIKEQKEKYFGKFLWGMDMLREKLEDNKQKELEFQKDKKTLILSLSHDIRTPLSSITLYAKALSENLYNDENKKQQAINGILKNTKEIKSYVEQIVVASRDNFLNLEVNSCEIYLAQIIKAIELYYNEKLSVLHIEFSIDNYDNCLLNGDLDRLVEVFQNVLENAIKYGDGKSIKIHFAQEENFELITIENTGCNLDDKELPNIFDSFYRGSNGKKVKGNGLGLYICKKLLKKMNGDIFAKIIKDRFIITIVVQMA